MTKMRWREYLPVIEEEQSFRKICLNVSGSRPKQLFDIVVEELDDIYFNDFKGIAMVTKIVEQNIDTDDTPETFRASILTHLTNKYGNLAPNKSKSDIKAMYACLNQVTNLNIRFFFQSALEKSLEDNEVEKKKKTKQRIP